MLFRRLERALRAPKNEPSPLCSRYPYQRRSAVFTDLVIRCGLQQFNHRYRGGDSSFLTASQHGDDGFFRAVFHAPNKSVFLQVIIILLLFVGQRVPMDLGLTITLWSRLTQTAPWRDPRCCIFDFNLITQYLYAARICSYLSLQTTFSIFLYGSISPLITCEKIRAVKPDTRATPCSLLLAG